MLIGVIFLFYRKQNVKSTNGYGEWNSQSMRSHNIAFDPISNGIDFIETLRWKWDDIEIFISILLRAHVNFHFFIYSEL